MITNSIFLEGGNYGGIFLLIILILLGPPILLAVIGLLLFLYKSRKVGKIFFILAGIYLVVGLGICGAMMAGF